MRNGVVTAVFCAFVAAAGLAGCSADGNKATEDVKEPQAEQARPAKAKDFDGSGMSDAGQGAMVLLTPGGTSEGGKVPQIALPKGTVVTQISLQTDGMDGSVCTLYIDGAENSKINAVERGEQAVTLMDGAIAAGVHKVELVRMDGGSPAVYKSASYEIVD